MGDSWHLDSDIVSLKICQELHVTAPKAMPRNDSTPSAESLGCWWDGYDHARRVVCSSRKAQLEKFLPSPEIFQNRLGQDGARMKYVVSSFG